jgi:hypothetical protein
MLKMTAEYLPRMIYSPAASGQPQPANPIHKSIACSVRSHCIVREQTRKKKTYAIGFEKV